MTRLVSTSLSLWLRRILLPLAVVASIAACSGKDQKDAYIEGTVEELYNAGQDNLSLKKYKEAAKFFEEVDRQHPFSVWATRAQLMAAFAYYKDKNFDSAIVSVDRFIRLHPSHRDIAYAYYLKGLAHYDQVRDVKRDTSSAARARNLRRTGQALPEYAIHARCPAEDRPAERPHGRRRNVYRPLLSDARPISRRDQSL